MRRLTILQLFSDENWTGPAEPVISLSKELAGRGHRVYFACSRRKGKLRERVKAAGIPLIEALRLDHHYNPISNLHDILTLPRVLRAYEVDIIHTNFSHDNAIGFLGGGWGKKRPYLVRTVHSAMPRLGLWERFLYGKMADRVITVCESVRGKLIDDLGLAPNKVTTIHGAVDIDRFSPANKGDSIKEELGLSPETPVVGMVAPLRSYRKHRCLLETIPRIKEAVPETKFLMVDHAGRSHQPVLKKLARKLKIEDDIIYTGYRDRDFPQVLAAMNVKVFLVPGADGSCRAVLEALATGKPVVAAPVGPIPEMAGDGFPGFIVNPEDKASFAKAVVVLLKDKALAKGKGESGRRLVEKYFREDIQAERVEEVYASLM